MKKLFYRHSLLIKGTTLFFTVLYLIVWLSESLKLSEFVLFTFSGLLIGFLNGIVFALISEVVHKIIKKPINVNSLPVPVKKENNIKSVKSKPKQKNSNDVASNMEYKVGHCSSCDNVTNILDRVKFTDGMLCNDCLKKYSLKKTIDLDLWAKEHSWRDISNYHER